MQAGRHALSQEDLFLTLEHEAFRDFGDALRTLPMVLPPHICTASYTN
jgi:hypothetical protein